MTDFPIDPNAAPLGFIVNPQTGQAAATGGNTPMAADELCEHHYETRILGGHPLHVPACTFCRRPEWDDLREQADELYRWGWQEGRAGKPVRERLSAYDKPREATSACIHPEGYEDECPCLSSCICCRVEAAARTTPDNPATSSDTADNCCVCGGGHVVYRNYREQPFCRRCANCGCNQDVCVRTGINDPAVSRDPELRQQIAAAIESDAERPRAQRVGIINAVMAVRDREMEQLRAKVAEVDHIINWHTTCASCARVLDSSYRETIRAEEADAALARIRALAEEHPVAVPTNLIDAALDEPTPGPAATQATDVWEQQDDGTWTLPFGDGYVNVPAYFTAEERARFAAALAQRQEPAPDELTAEEARALADELGTDRAQDALAFVAECCDIADREQRPVSTRDVREWLKGAQCGRRLAADNPSLYEKISSMFARPLPYPWPTTPPATTTAPAARYEQAVQQVQSSGPQPAAHDDGPSVAECTEADRVWPLQREGE